MILADLLVAIPETRINENWLINLRSLLLRHSPQLRKLESLLSNSAYAPLVQKALLFLKRDYDALVYNAARRIATDPSNDDKSYGQEFLPADSRLDAAALLNRLYRSEFVELEDFLVFHRTEKLRRFPFLKEDDILAKVLRGTSIPLFGRTSSQLLHSSSAHPFNQIVSPVYQIDRLTIEAFT